MALDRQVLCAAMLSAAANFAGAQRIQPEARADVLGPRPYAVQAAAGVNVALGYYVRAELDLGYAPRALGDLAGDHWRGDVLARLTLDPFRQERWGLSFGGGLSLRRHVALAAAVDLEGPEMRGILPALQLGVSKGMRAGLILRRAIAGRR